MSPPGRQPPTTAAVENHRQEYMKLYRKRAIKKREEQVESQTATEVRIPLLLRISQHCDGRPGAGCCCVAGSTLGGRMGQKQTLAPMIDSGSCDRQSWRIIKMKLATGQTAAKSETKGFVLSYYSGR